MVATLQDRIKQLRLEAHMTQEDLAKELRVSKGAVGNWETGIRRPSPETLEEMSDLFNINMDYLLGRTDKRPEFSLEEKWIIKCYRNADEDTKTAVQAILRRFWVSGTSLED